jgi:uncharacterized membrane protein HdeD (DUF308 family)
MRTMFLRHWWAVALRGVLAILFGLVALVLPRLTLTALVIVFGAFALVGGIFAIVAAFGIYAIVFGVLLLILAFQWRRLRRVMVL